MDRFTGPESVLDNQGAKQTSSKCFQVNTQLESDTNRDVCRVRCCSQMKPLKWCQTVQTPRGASGVRTLLQSYNRNIQHKSRRTAAEVITKLAAAQPPAQALVQIVWYSLQIVTPPSKHSDVPPLLLREVQLPTHLHGIVVC